MQCKVHTYTVITVPLCLFKHHAVKVYEGVEVQCQVLLISALYESGLSVSRLGRFTPRVMNRRFP